MSLVPSRAQPQTRPPWALHAQVARRLAQAAQLAAAPGACPRLACNPNPASPGAQVARRLAQAAELAAAAQLGANERLAAGAAAGAPGADARAPTIAGEVTGFDADLGFLMTCIYRNLACEARARPRSARARHMRRATCGAPVLAPPGPDRVGPRRGVDVVPAHAVRGRSALRAAAVLPCVSVTPRRPSPDDLGSHALLCCKCIRAERRAALWTGDAASKQDT